VAGVVVPVAALAIGGAAVAAFIMLKKKNVPAQDIELKKQFPTGNVKESPAYQGEVSHDNPHFQE
jgi:hypothetical protein